MMTIPIQSISRLLPQTQCRECGYEGCLPYARALSAGEASVNLCAPGGETVMKDLADLLGKPYLAPAKTQIKAVANSMRSESTNKRQSPPSVIADTVKKIVTARKPRTRYVVGFAAKPLVTLRRILPDRAFDRIMSAGQGARH